MALDDKDKKFIKDTIDNSVNKNVDSQMKKTTTEWKRESLSRSQEERIQRAKYIEELKKVQDDGQATMAQKFELFKEEMKQTIPDDFKNTWKDVSSTVGKGANKLGSGLDKAASRLMNLNPITAMLWNNKDILGDLIGGTAQMGWGLMKGVGGAAAGIVNNATNNIISKIKGSKKQKEEQPEEQEPIKIPTKVIEQQESEQDELVVPDMFEEESNAERIAKFSEDMENKINEIHEIVLKEQKGQAKELSKGLSGMQKTMDAIKGVTDMLKAKQAVIATGVILGAAAIVGLVAWFKSGGLQNMLNNVGKNILKGLASKEGQEARQKADEYVKGEMNKIKEDAEQFDTMNKNMNLANGSDFSKTSYMTKPGGPDATTLRTQDLQNSLQKEGFSKTRSIKATQAVGFGLVAAKYKNIGASKPWVLKLPFETWIGGGSDIIKIDGDDIHVDFVLSRGKGKNTKAVIFTNAVKNSVKSATFKPNTQIAILDVNSRLIGDWEGFCGLKDGQSYEEMLYNDRKKDIAKQANKIMDEAYHTAGLDSIAREADKRLGVFKEYTEDNLMEGGPTPTTTNEQTPAENPTETFTPTEEQPDNYGTAPDGGKGTPKGTPTGGAADIKSENEIKVQEQNEQLKQSTQPKPQSEQKGYTGTLPQLQSNVNIQPEPNETDTWPDKVTMVQLDKMLPNGYGMDY